MLFSLLLTGSRPGGRGTFFCFAKRKYPKKRRAEIVVPSLRYGHLALLGFFGGMCKLASLKQAHTLIRKNLRCSATLHGASGIGQPGQSDVRVFCGDEYWLSAWRGRGVNARARSDELSGTRSRQQHVISGHK